MPGRVAGSENVYLSRWPLRKVPKKLKKCSRDRLYHSNTNSRGSNTDRRVARANPIKDGRGRRPALKTGQTQQKMARGSHAGRPEWAARDDPELTNRTASAGAGRCYQQLRRTKNTSGRVAGSENVCLIRWPLRKVQKFGEKCSRDRLHHSNTNSRG